VAGAGFDLVDAFDGAEIDGVDGEAVEGVGGQGGDGALGERGDDLGDAIGFGFLGWIERISAVKRLSCGR